MLFIQATVKVPDDFSVEKNGIRIIMPREFLYGVGDFIYRHPEFDRDLLESAFGNTQFRFAIGIHSNE